jgi:hypothetical protein
MQNARGSKKDLHASLHGISVVFIDCGKGVCPSKWKAARGDVGVPGTADQKRNPTWGRALFPNEEPIFAVASREWNYQDMTGPIKLRLGMPQ